jgi:hypothetical protein
MALTEPEQLRETIYNRLACEGLGHAVADWLSNEVVSMAVRIEELEQRVRVLEEQADE